MSARRITLGLIEEIGLDSRPPRQPGWSLAFGYSLRDRRIQPLHCRHHNHKAFGGLDGLSGGKRHPSKILKWMGSAFLISEGPIS
jgi:hypothetical protein